jgi:PPOX class probable FMN-dependent enzyme
MDREPLIAEPSAESRIADASQLRGCYAEPSVLARQKSLTKLDKHCRNFIALSPFLCLGSASDAGTDVSPRGDAPGFVRVLDDATLLIPDRPGNNRLDSLANLLANPNVGLLFLIPGVEETLRVNGNAEITTDPALLASAEVHGKRPKSALIVHVREAFLHCGKAVIRARLWQEDYRVERKTLPSLGRMITEQVATGITAEQADASIAEAYVKRLY